MKLIILCGKANSGKTTLRHFLEHSLDIPGISASDYTKAQTTDYSRKNLENIFLQNIQKYGFHGLCQKIIDTYFKNTSAGIIDGIRHKKMIEAVQKNIGKENCLIIYIKISPQIRFLFAQKSKKIEGKNFDNFQKFETTSNHEQKVKHIKPYAHIIIGEEIFKQKEDTYQKIIQKIQFFLQ